MPMFAGNIPNMQGETLDYYCLILVPLFFWGKCPPTLGLYNNTTYMKEREVQLLGGDLFKSFFMKGNQYVSPYWTFFKGILRSSIRRPFFQNGYFLVEGYIYHDTPPPQQNFPSHIRVYRSPLCKDISWPPTTLYPGHIWVYRIPLCKDISWLPTTLYPGHMWILYR